MSKLNILDQITSHNYAQVLLEYQKQKAVYQANSSREVNQSVNDFLVIKAIFEVLQQNSPEQYKHCTRLTDLAVKFSNNFKLTNEEMKNLILATKYHDIGKINIDKNILNKPGKLNDSEWEEIKKHPTYSKQILSQTKKLSGLAKYVESHHERYDGTGYPNGLSGEQIPLVSRIISVFDAYEVMTTGRVYKEALTHAQAIEELKRCAGTQFDPKIVTAFEKITKPDNHCEII